MSAALVSMVGTTTKVCDAEGMPAEKSIRGSGCGATIICTTQLTSSTAAWLEAISETMPTAASNHSRAPSPYAVKSNAPARLAVTSVIAPR